MKIPQKIIDRLIFNGFFSDYEGRCEFCSHYEESLFSDRCKDCELINERMTKFELDKDVVPPKEEA